MTTKNTSERKPTGIDDLSTEQLEQALRERYGIDEATVKKSTDNPTTPNKTTIDNIANNVFGIIIAVILLGMLFFIFVAMNNSSYSSYSSGSSSSSSSKTDWNAYCRDMFPDNDEYSKAAREGCINGGKTTDNLIDGKYDK